MLWGLLFKNFKSKKMNGIDVSHHQDRIDFKKVIADSQKIEFVYMKATQGVGYTDTRLHYNAVEAKKVATKIGYYHYASLNTRDIVKDSVDEARYFVSVIANCPFPDLPVVLDIEENKAGLSPNDIMLWINTFFDELTKLGYKDHVLYSYTPFLNANLPTNHNLGNIKLWIAAYTNTKSPRLPIGWKDHWLWQYSAKGKIDGISGDVDMNKSVNPIF